jgi:hypothetical protein
MGAGGHGGSGGALVMSPAEELLFLRMKQGFLKLGESGQVRMYHFIHRRWIEKKPNQHPLSGRWRFMFPNGSGGRTTVYRNRLVWMLANGRKIPDDCFVDHEDGDRLNDHPDNLKLMRKADSHSQGNGEQERINFHRLWKWFHFIELHGRPPSEEEEGDDQLLF